MNKLSKHQTNERDEVAGNLKDRREELNEVVEKYNTAKNKLWDEELVPALTAYNEALEKAQEWVGGVESAIGDYIDTKSDTWRDSDKGTAVEGWKNSFETCDYESIEVEKPEDLTFLDDVEDHADLLEQLPESPE